jgi:hypothetical protein
VRVVLFIGKSVRVVSLPVTGWVHPVVIAEPGKALTDNDRDRANKIAPTASVIRTIRAWRKSVAAAASRAVESHYGSCTFESCRPDLDQLGAA